MKPQVGDKIWSVTAGELTVEARPVMRMLSVYDFTASSPRLGTFYYADDHYGVDWVPAGDLEAFAAMLATQAMR